MAVDRGRVQPVRRGDVDVDVAAALRGESLVALVLRVVIGRDVGVGGRDVLAVELELREGGRIERVAGVVVDARRGQPAVTLEADRAAVDDAGALGGELEDLDAEVHVRGVLVDIDVQPPVVRARTEPEHVVIGLVPVPRGVVVVVVRNRRGRLVDDLQLTRIIEGVVEATGQVRGVVEDGEGRVVAAAGLAAVARERIGVEGSELALFVAVDVVGPAVAPAEIEVMQFERVVLQEPVGVDASLPDLLVQSGVGDADYSVWEGRAAAAGVEAVVRGVELVPADLVQSEDRHIGRVVAGLQSRGDDAAGDRVGRVAGVGQHVGREDDAGLVLRADDARIVVRERQDREALDVDRAGEGEVLRRRLGEDHAVAVADAGGVEVGLVSGDVHAVGREVLPHDAEDVLHRQPLGRGELQEVGLVDAVGRDIGEVERLQVAEVLRVALRDDRQVRRHLDVLLAVEVEVDDELVAGREGAFLKVRRTVVVDVDGVEVWDAGVVVLVAEHLQAVVAARAVGPFDDDVVGPAGQRRDQVNVERGVDASGVVAPGPDRGDEPFEVVAVVVGGDALGLERRLRKRVPVGVDDADLGIQGAAELGGVDVEEQTRRGGHVDPVEVDVGDGPGDARAVFDRPVDERELVFGRAELVVGRVAQDVLVKEVVFQVEGDVQAVVGLAAGVDVLRVIQRVVDLLLLDAVERHDVDLHVDNVEVAVDAKLAAGIGRRTEVRVVIGDKHLQVELRVDATVARVLEPPVDHELVLDEDRAGGDRTIRQAGVGRVVVGRLGGVADDAERLLLVAEVAADDLVEQRVVVRVEPGDRADDVLALDDVGAARRALAQLRVLDQAEVVGVDVVLDQVELLVGDDRAGVLAHRVGDAEDEPAGVEVGQHLRAVAQRRQLGARRQGRLVALGGAVRLRQDRAVQADRALPDANQVNADVDYVWVDAVDGERAVRLCGREAGVDVCVEPQIVVGVDEHRRPGEQTVALVLDAVGVVVDVNEPTNRARVRRGAGQEHTRLQQIGCGSPMTGRPLRPRASLTGRAGVPRATQPIQAGRRRGGRQALSPRGQRRERGGSVRMAYGP